MAAVRIHGTQRRRELSGVTSAGLTLLTLVLACAASLVVAFANGAYFDLVNGIIGARETVARGLVFSSWLVLVGAVVVAWDPRSFGFRLGDIAAHWRLVAATVAIAAVVTAMLVALTGPTPYSDASLLIETVVVPVTEELVFRAALLTLLVVVLGRLHERRTALALAVLFDGFAFGLAHVANAVSIDPAWVLSQMTFASALGAVCAYLMVRTRSVYPAMLLHGVVNSVVVLI
jgi:membrane protease YdiL (CAAX protease family)